MKMFNCNCRYNCTGLGIIASIILGVVTAFLTFTATITVTPAFLWVLFGIGVVGLAFLLIYSALLRRSTAGGCICNILPAVLTGILGTILTAVILLGITFAATSIIGAIITGVLIFFFSLIITSTACLISCTAGCSEED